MSKRNKIFALCKNIQPIFRSILGRGNYRTLRFLKKINKKLKIISFNSNQKVFDWKIPKEWNLKDAFVEDIFTGNKVIDFKKNMLAVAGYSQPVDKIIELKDLKKKIFTTTIQKDAYPYVNFFYQKNWAFTMPHKNKKKLKGKKYRVKINSSFKNGKLHVGELLIKGRLKKEILLTSYICHPFMANNEISGPSVLTYIAKWLSSKKKRKYSYRILFLSETIGAISYINKNIKLLKKNVIGGYVITCVGDERSYSYLKSKNEKSLSDKVALEEFSKIKKRKKIYSWLDRGSDERQFNAPGVDLDIGSIMRSKYGTYKEYHTSSDNFNKVVTSKGLSDSFNLIKKIILRFETKIIPVATVKCEPFLSKRNIYYRSIAGQAEKNNKNLWNFVSYCDGKYFLEDIAKKVKISNLEAKKILKILYQARLIEF
jgi:aminopeptidase-like protein